MSRRRRKPKNWLNSTPWPDHFLRRLVSWTCRELGYPRRSLKGIEFGNRTNAAWSGHGGGWSDHGYILVRVGPESRFPTNTRVHRDGFSVGRIADRVEALVMVTAHEIAHCDAVRRGNKTRRSYRSHGNTVGSERYINGRAKQVLEAFREKRDELLAEWEKPPARQKAKPKSPVQKRAENAFAKEAEWERKLAQAKRLYAKWKRKADYYRKTYPDGEYPEPPKRKAAEPKPETVLQRKISRYITMVVKDADLGSCQLEVHVFGDDQLLTRPSRDYEWEGFQTDMRDTRKRAKLGDCLEVRGYRRPHGEYWEDVDVVIPADEETLDECLRRELPVERLRPAKAATQA